MSDWAWALPIFSGACDAASRGVIKATRVHRFTLIAMGFLFALPIYGAWLLIEGMPEVKSLFWIAVACHVPLFVIAQILTIEAHRSSPLMLTVPYLSFTPAFLLVIAPLMGGGEPTSLGALGVALLTAGLYFLNFDGRAGWFAPFRALFRERGSWMMFLVAFIFAITSTFDYWGFVNGSAPLWLLVDHGMSAIVVGALTCFYVMHGKLEWVAVSPRGAWKNLVLYGGVIAFSVVAHMLAFRWIPVVPYVIATKRAGAILLTVSLGLFMGLVMRHKDFANERERLRVRVPAILLMVAGMTIIILWGRSSS